MTLNSINKNVRELSNSVTLRLKLGNSLGKSKKVCRSFFVKT